jgi:hypothetical protein
MDHRFMVVRSIASADLDDLVQLKACVVHWRSMELYLLIRGPWSFIRFRCKCLPLLYRESILCTCLAEEKSYEQHMSESKGNTAN